MAKMNLKGISIEQLLNMEDDQLLALARQGLNRSEMTKEKYDKAKRDQFAQITSRVVSAANKRIQQLGKSKIGRTSPAYLQALRTSPTGKFSIKGQNFNQLRHTMKIAKEWLNYKTSTVKGWKIVRANIKQDTGFDFDTEYKKKKFWKVYRMLYEAESNAGIIARKGSSSRLSSDRIQKVLIATITKQKDVTGRRNFDWRSSVDKILQQAQINIDNMYKYETMTDENSTDIGTSRIVSKTDEEE